MKICIVNPGRCGGTLMLCYLHSKLSGYEMKYEVTTNDLPKSKDIIFKYQYLYTHEPLEGADKYIVCDRRDREAWLFSTYMSSVNSHHHGVVKDSFKFNHLDYNDSKLGMNKVYEEVWVPERERLLKAGADMVWYEDMKIKEDVYLGATKLVPVWSCKRK
tara:strand:- start:507 stop:986 length:480 start_codon:yes stop_codon:yes gene_type:complete